MHRFWTMLAHYHGQTWNGAAIARSIDVSEAMVRRLVDALTDALVVRQLPAWYANCADRRYPSRLLIRSRMAVGGAGVLPLAPAYFSLPWISICWAITVDQPVVFQGRPRLPSAMLQPVAPPASSSLNCVDCI